MEYFLSKILAKFQAMSHTTWGGPCNMGDTVLFGTLLTMENKSPYWYQTRFLAKFQAISHTTWGGPCNVGDTILLERCWPWKINTHITIIGNRLTLNHNGGS